MHISDTGGYDRRSKDFRRAHSTPLGHVHGSPKFSPWTMLLMIQDPDGVGLCAVTLTYFSTEEREAEIALKRYFS